MPSALLSFFLRRTVRAAMLVLTVSSSALVLVHLAPGDAFSSFETDSATAAAERARLGLDRPFIEQYAVWLRRAATLDFGESTRFRRPVAALLSERVSNTLLLGSAALVLAIGLGVPAGVVTGSAPRQWWARTLSGSSLLLVATPPLVTALVLLLIASRTGWLSSVALDGGPAAGVIEAVGAAVRHLPLPAIALALPIAASIERMQSRAVAEALQLPCIAAARARGVSRRRVTWHHAFRLSLTPVLGVLGIVIGTILSGSFVVEIVMSWPGLGDLMYQALVARDTHLAAGCAAAGALFLAFGILVGDVALMIANPLTAEPA